ncbi:2'-5' RNA ligase family protein [Nocardioides sp. GY 10113]|uniref:2'-5' RNA ligase family protein n=1 Tax=Nocardioides sp. GY 10113 TaxID=2569761 RepID=UPI0010A89E71|nr:2'-5' RNA ligase family protein [Nocardioides sp. GY 10113]TIC89110.1 2'-5' RNA ligase family protein [Nocardioides sp. GY 10113]
MALAVCLLFDDRSDRLVRELWSRLEDAGVATLATHTHGHHQPHLSYAVLRDWDLDRVREALATLPPARPWPMSFHGTLAFPRGRAALAPAVTADLALRQWRIATALKATGADLHRNYESGEWVPHVAVATRAQGDQLATVVKAIADVLPMTVRVDRAALIDSSTGQTWPLRRIP